MKKINLITLVTLIVSVVIFAQHNNADAFSVTGNVTADNHYGLYHGYADGSGLTFVGRNEYGQTGNPGVENWSNAETWTFNVTPGEYLYTLCWNDEQWSAWVGDFSWTGGSLFTNTTDWEYYIGSGVKPTDPTLSANWDLPSLSIVSAEIAGATWATPLYTQTQGDLVPDLRPWGDIPEVNNSANYIWHDTHGLNSSSNYNKYVIFRTKNPLAPLGPPDPIIPEPSTLLLLGSGLVGLVINKRKKVLKLRRCNKISTCV